MNNKKCLVFTWYFPPINSSEGICTYKLVNNSKKNYDIFTQNSNSNWSYGKNAILKLNSNINVVKNDSSDIESWQKEAVKYFEKNKDKYDSIMSRSNEPESHDIALIIKRKYPKIKWIASFGDPIANNPYNNLFMAKSPYKIKGNDILNQPILKILSPKRIIKNMWWNYKNEKYLRLHTRYYKNKKTEKNTILNCDYLVFNNKYQMEYMLNGYSKKVKDKSIIIPHSFDKCIYGKSNDKKNDKFTISYLGHLDDDRTPRQLLKALCHLKNERYDLYNKIVFNVYGNMSSKDKVYIVDNSLSDVVHFKSSVDYLNSLIIMSESDLLLVIDANLTKYIDTNIFFAAKISDYIGAGKPIFAITMQNGASADIIRDVGGCVSSFSENEIYMYLVNIIEGKLKINLNKNVEIYNVKIVAEEFDKFVGFERLCKK